MNSQGRRQFFGWKSLVVILAVVLPVMLLIVGCAGAASTPPAAPATSAAASATAPAIAATTAGTYSGLADLKPIELSWSSSSPPNIPMGRGVVAFWDQVQKASQGKITSKVYWAGSLLGPAEQPKGIASGVADTGDIFSTVAPASWPVTTYGLSLGWLSEDSRILTGAWAELMASDPQLQAEFTKQNLVPLWGIFSANYITGCSKKVESAKDWQGLRVRVPGSAFADFVKAMGGVVVTLPSAAEITDGLAKGMIDCSMHSPSGWVDATFTEYVSHFETTKLLPMVFWTAMNKTKWAALPPLAKQIIVDNLAFGDQYYARADTDLFTPYYANPKFTFSDGDASLKDKVKVVRSQLLDEAVSKAQAEGKVKDPAALRQSFEGLLKKWTGIVDSVAPGRTGKWGDTEWQQYSARLQQEIGSKWSSVFP